MDDNLNGLSADGKENVWKKFLYYEKLKEKGLLAILPCAIGDRVYAVTRNIISEYEITGIDLRPCGMYFQWRCISGIYPGHPGTGISGFSEEALNKYVFQDRNDAVNILNKRNT